MFSIMTAKLFAGLAVGLLVALLLLNYFRGNEIAGLKAELATERTALADCESARRVQNAAIAKAGEDAAQTRRDFLASVAAGNQAIRDAQGKVTVVRTSPRNNCPTPTVIRGADL